MQSSDVPHINELPNKKFNSSMINDLNKFQKKEENAGLGLHR